MNQAISILALIVAGFALVERLFGYDVAYVIGFGTVTVMSVMISLTFFWLWRERATPLALGMSFSWAGAAATLGWYWVFQVLREPAVMIDSAAIFAFLSVYLVGALHHFEVMQRSLGVRHAALAVPIAAMVLAGLAMRFLP